MSYRSFKRVLGETNLERKCRFLFGTCLLVLITGSFYWYGKQTEKIVYERNPETGRLLVHMTLFKHWSKLETNEEFKPIVEALIEELDAEDYETRAIRPAANIPDKQDKRREFEPLGAFEKELIERWREQPAPRSDGKPPFENRESTDKHEYQYYQPIYLKTSNCVVCHRQLNPNLDLNEGDLQAIIQVRIPTAQVQKSISRNWAILWAIAIFTVFLAMVFLYVIIRYVIVKPLKHLRYVSDEISQGNTDVRADIHTRDEFEALAVAFNRMLQKILDSSQELRELNTVLDSKVDELAQTNMRLFEMNRLKGDFLATMSHELRTPLNSIIGFSDVLDSIDTLDEKQQRYVKNIQQSGRLLLEMINDILDLAKIESGKMELNLTDFRIEPVVTAQCDMARPLAEKKNLDLTTELEAGLPSLRQDQGKIQQILNNLLSNAIKFTPEGGRIHVAARRSPRGDVELEVTDTGVGIADDDQTSVFEKFRQGQVALSGGDAMTREYSGTGLGLSIIKELCKLLGGEISLKSELGKGSTFTVHLPWVREEQPRLDSPLTGELEEMTRPPRIELTRQRDEALASSPSSVET